MILSNFTLFFISQKNQCMSFLLPQKSYFKNSDISIKKRSINNNLILFTSNNKYVQKDLSLFDNSIPFQKVVYPNIWQRLVNTYLQETVFLSSSNKLTSNYISKLKTMGLSIYDSNQNRNFLYKFSRNLINGSIDVRSINYDNSNFHSNTHLKYVWLKRMNFNCIKFVSLKQLLNSIFNKYSSFSFNSSLPLFIIINNNNEIVMSESTNCIHNVKHLSNTYDNLFSKFLTNASNDQSQYTCLLFVNYHDAMEYKNYISYKNVNSTRSLKMEVVPSSMYLYNKLKFFYSNKIDFRLIPDLEEVSNLVYRYSKYKNVLFNSNQKYGYNFFQGQPLYQINLNKIQHKFNPKIKNLELIKSNNQYTNNNTFFLNYVTAINTWKRILKESSNANLPQSPYVVVSNLESFINDKQSKKSFHNIIFLPSVENYMFIKKYLTQSLQGEFKLRNWLYHKGFYVKTLCHRVLWSLTSRQPNNW
uniref:Ycf80 n=1 Tax=Vertebrata thuyoides TaxID=2006970 RepID=A0A1Z1MAG6_9FLOR|nr:hypothetical protein [Vertebrata thuyoides]ARW63077.1 hypothetical protein [Vertebrata thuyoides]